MQDQNCENEDANSSNNSLRRKLFYDDDHAEEELVDSNVLSPIKSKTPANYNISPPQSGMFFHGTPLRVCVNSPFLKVILII